MTVEIKQDDAPIKCIRVTGDTDSVMVISPVGSDLVRFGIGDLWVRIPKSEAGGVAHALQQMAAANG